MNILPSTTDHRRVTFRVGPAVSLAAIRRLLLVLLPVALAACGGSDGPSGPDDDGNGDVETIRPDAATWTGRTITLRNLWTVPGSTACTVCGPPCYGGYPTCFDTTDAQGLFAGGTIAISAPVEAWIPTVYPGCDRQEFRYLCARWLDIREARIESPRMDLSRYSSARLKFRIRAYHIPREINPDEGFYTGRLISFTVRVKSNVPGTDDIAVLDWSYMPTEMYADSTLAHEVDVSLENALGFREATVEIDCQQFTPGMSWRFRPGVDPATLRFRGFVELSDLRIVGER